MQFLHVPHELFLVGTQDIRLLTNLGGEISRHCVGQRRETATERHDSRVCSVDGGFERDDTEAGSSVPDARTNLLRYRHY